MSSCEPGRTRAYSNDMRWRIVWLKLSEELSSRQIATRLCIGYGTVSRIIEMFRQTGDVEKRRNSSRPHIRVLTDYHEFFILGLLMDHPALQLEELCHIIAEATNLIVSPPTICRLLKRYGYTRKIIRRIALQRSVAVRSLYLAQSYMYDSRCFIWLDETGNDRRNFLRKYGYALRGERATKHTFLSRGKRVNAILGLSSTGIVTKLLHEGTLDGNKFYDFVRGDLLPQLHSFDGEAVNSVVIMDNCAVHHCSEITALLHDCGIVTLYLPPFSPDLNPVEEAFSYIKSYLKLHEDVLEATNDPVPIINEAINSITSNMCKQWIAHSGYEIHNE